MNSAEKPLISIVIPVYNVEKYLDRCVKSVIGQTYKRLEIILVDDGSPDNCGEMCEEYKRLDGRVRVIHKENGGLSDARNAGIEEAQGEYIGFVDSDDYIETNMYETLYNALKEADADISICNFRYVGAFEEKNEEATIQNGVIDCREVLIENLNRSKSHYWIVAWNKLYKREIFDSVRYRTGKLHEDEFAIHEILFGCDRMACVRSMLYNYVQRNGSITSKYSINRLDSAEAMLERARFYLDNNISDEAACKSASSAMCSFKKAYEAGVGNKEPYASRMKELHYQYKRLARSLIFKHISLREGIKLISYYISPYAVWNMKNKMKACKKNLKNRLRRYKCFFHAASYIKDLRNYDYILVGTPTHPNIGDAAIAAAEINFFDNIGIKLLELPSRYLKGYEKFYAWITPKDKIILVHGGGFLGCLWPKEEKSFRRIVSGFKKNKIIVLPQTVTFDTETKPGYDLFEESRKIYASHTDMTVFVREKKSFDFMRDHMPEIKTVLVPDIVTSMKIDIPEQSRSGVIMCLRADIEKALSDEGVRTIMNALEQTYPEMNIDFTDTMANSVIMPQNRERIVKDKLTQFAGARLIITDRLHGMVFAALANTPCIALGNSNGKVKAVYEWIRGNEYVKYADSADDVERILETLDLGKGYRFDYDLLNEKFAPLINEIKQI